VGDGCDDWIFARPPQMMVLDETRDSLSPNSGIEMEPGFPLQARNDGDAMTVRECCGLSWRTNW
jgi:hypothetical protein